MSAATITKAVVTAHAEAVSGLTVREAETIAGARAVLSYVRADSFPWPDEGGVSITVCADGIADCLEEHEALRKHDRHPESVFPDLGRHQDNALQIALERVTQDIADWTGAVIIAIREKCGDHAATMANWARMEPPARYYVAAPAARDGGEKP